LGTTLQYQALHSFAIPRGGCHTQD
jgi:hypothetical protein